MRVAIVSDIHGNRHAFEAVLDAIGASDCEEMWCLGDLVGYGAEPDACVEACFRVAKKSAELIDLNHHKGEHPRMGAVDVIPFIPVAGVTIQDCVKLAAATSLGLGGAPCANVVRWGSRRWGLHGTGRQTLDGLPYPGDGGLAEFFDALKDGQAGLLAEDFAEQHAERADVAAQRNFLELAGGRLEFGQSLRPK